MGERHVARTCPQVCKALEFHIVSTTFHINCTTLHGATYNKLPFSIQHIEIFVKFGCIRRILLLLLVGVQKVRFSIFVCSATFAWSGDSWPGRQEFIT